MSEEVNDTSSNLNEEQEVLDLNDQEQVDSLSEEELEREIENFGSETEEPQQEQEQEQEVVPENVENETEVNETDDFTPPEEIAEVFNKLPESYQRLFKPIKANGREQVYTPDEMVKLVQLGSNYYKNQERIKPKLQLTKMLEKAGIEDQEQLTLALDIMSGNEEALAKLIKEKNIDLYKIDNMGDEVNYQPDTTKYEVHETDMQLEEVDKYLKDNSQDYDRTYEVLSSMDENSREALFGEPEKIKVLDAHISNGVYNTIVSEIEKRKVFGEFLNTTFLEAYEKVGNELISSMQQNQKAPVQQQVQTSSEPQQQVVPNVNIPSSISSNNVQRQEAPIAPITIDLNDERYIDSLSPEELKKLLS